MFGAWRTGGMIFRGSGLAASGAGAATFTTGGATLTATGGAGFAGAWLLRAASSSACFFARIAFTASPGLEICDRSTLG